MKATVTSKGQVAVPKACRNTLGLKTGTVLEFEAGCRRAKLWTSIWYRSGDDLECR